MFLGSPNDAHTTAKDSIVPLPAAATTRFASAVLSTGMFSASDSTATTDPSRDDAMMTAEHHLAPRSHSPTPGL